MRNIEALKNYFLGKDPQLKETLADNSLRLIGIPGREFVLRAELIKRLKELKDTLDKEDQRQQQEIDDLIADLNSVKNTYLTIGSFEQQIANYYTKSQVDALLSVIPRFSIKVVDHLPTNPLDISPTTIYLVPGNTNGNPLENIDNYYDEYIYVNNDWELIGTTQIDMSDYYTKEEVNAMVPFTTLEEDWTILENSSMNPLIASGWYYTGDHAVYYGDNVDPVIMNDAFFYYGGGQPEDQWFYFVPVNIQDMQNQIDVRLWFDVTENEWKYAGYGIIEDIAALKQNPNANLSAAIPTVNATEAEYVIKSGDTMTGGLTTPNLTVGSRATESIIGTNSVAEGNGTIASGARSHAEGAGTTASGTNSHAEGYATTSSGGASHTEGSRCTASGNNSHAEGSATIASGKEAHAEGIGTEASGDYSHAEGSHTTAFGDMQHTSGGYNLVSTSNTVSLTKQQQMLAIMLQRAIAGTGIETITDVNNGTAVKDAYNDGVYAFTIGNGVSNISDDYKSNAATIDWDGNGWFAGDVYVGSTSGTNKDSGSKKLESTGNKVTSITASSTDDKYPSAKAVYDFSPNLTNYTLDITAATEGTSHNSDAWYQIDTSHNTASLSAGTYLVNVKCQVVGASSAGLVSCRMKIDTVEKARTTIPITGTYYCDGNSACVVTFASAGVHAIVFEGYGSVTWKDGKTFSVSFIRIGD